MDFKKILAVCLLIFVFAAGAVSASNDISSDNNQTALETNEDLGQQDDLISADSNEDELKTVDEDILDVNEDGEDIIGYDESRIAGPIEDWGILDEKREVLFFESVDSNATGNFSVYVDGSVRYSCFVNKSDYTSGTFLRYIYLNDLNIHSKGTYQIKTTFNDKVLDEKSVDVMNYRFIVYEAVYGYGKPLEFYVILPDGANAPLTLKINGKSYDVKYEGGQRYVSVDTKGWNVGEYVATFTYAGDDIYDEDTKDVTIHFGPYVNDIFYMSVGEKEYFEFLANPGLNDYAEITTYRLDNENYIKLSNATINFKDGKAKFNLDNLGVGFYKFNVTYHIGKATGNMALTKWVLKNTEGFSASVSPSKINAGSTVTVKVKGPKLPNNIEVYVDGKLKKTVLMSKGGASFKLSGLSVGTHKIRFWLEMNDETTDDYQYEYGRFFSYTAYVTVKKFTKLTLSKVKVKKSAKKLTIKATLKIDGKAVKGKTIKFKFNKKTYKAKTNKKGVAKITVKRAILKKLKVGKKVKYQATYGKKTVKRTVKVKW